MVSGTSNMENPTPPIVTPPVVDETLVPVTEDSTLTLDQSPKREKIPAPTPTPIVPIAIRPDVIPTTEELIRSQQGITL